MTRRLPWFSEDFIFLDKAAWVTEWMTARQREEEDNKKGSHSNMCLDWQPHFWLSVTHLLLSVQIRAERLKSSRMEVGIRRVEPVGGASFVMKCWALCEKKKGWEAAGSPVAMVTFVPGWVAAVCDREAAEDCVSNQCRNLANKARIAEQPELDGARRYLDPVHGFRESRLDGCLALLPHGFDAELEQLRTWI